ncbi:hypothetical protein L6Q96_20875 [Candidatus Binatia bacterium]|nr:hypothetical protein [Candidatus Binatia bacterium]
MHARLALLSRIAEWLLRLCAVALLVATVAGAFAVYMTATGQNLGLLRRAAALIGTLAAGQHTERMELDVRVVPGAGTLSGTAGLAVRVREDGRRRFYFLLNEGLGIESVTASGLPPGARIAAYRLWLITVVDVGVPLPRDTLVDFRLTYAGRPASALEFGGSSAPIGAAGVLLDPGAFWYPADLQGFFVADTTVTVPATFTVVHNGAEVAAHRRGHERVVRWTLPRPVAGLALVAGRYTVSGEEGADFGLRVALEEGIDLDPARIRGLMRSAHGVLTERFGPSGFGTATLFVSRDLRRGFNDGSGVMGLAMRYFRAGDYGFAVIAHELAHNWWGSTVAERWLVPGTGGEWIVEGFAGLGSLVAAEAVYGPEALARRLSGEFFDPERQGVLSEMSVIDNVVDEARSRDTIYRKGAYVAMMLRTILGDEAYFGGLRTFLDQYRYRQVSDRDLQQTLETASGQSLDSYFAQWVRSPALADLALDGTTVREATVQNVGAAALPGPFALWRLPAAGPPERLTAGLGDTVPLAPGDTLILDPLLTWADMWRENNRYPRRDAPVFVAAADGARAVTRGERFPWARGSVERVVAGGANVTWNFDRGFAQEPMWMPDGSTVLVSASEAPHALPAVVLLADKDTRTRLGFALTPAPAPDGTIYAASGSRLIQARHGRWSTALDEPGWTLSSPRPAPDGRTVAYTAARGNTVELRLFAPSGPGSRALLTADRDRVLYRWAPDSTRLYVVIGGSWDWHLLDVPANGGPARVLVHGAAAIDTLAVSPNGGRVAFSAAPALDYPTNRRQLFVLDVEGRRAHNIELPGRDAGDLTWTDDDTLLVVVTPSGADAPWHLPATRSVVRVTVSTGAVADTVASK